MFPWTYFNKTEHCVVINVSQPIGNVPVAKCTITVIRDFALDLHYSVNHLDHFKLIDIIQIATVTSNATYRALYPIQYTQ